MSFFITAAGLIGKLVISIGAKSLGDRIKDVKTQRRMSRLVDDAVDRIVEQTEEYLKSEKVSDERKVILVKSLCEKLKPLADDPQRFFVGDLDGSIIFKQCHPDGKLPEEIREEQLGQFYTVLFPQIAHFLAGSRIALAEWQAEGLREEFKRLSQLAEEIRAMNAKVADMPGAVAGVLDGRAGQEAEVILREFSQMLLNGLLLRLDLSPLRAERALHGSMGEHFVIPSIREWGMLPQLMVDGKDIVEILAAPGARRILHGGAGVGKTTCALWLQSRLLQSDPSRLAVVFRLREVVNIEQQSLLELLRERAGAHLRGSISDKLLRSWQETGRLVVILDGFDEVPEHRRDAVEFWIKSLAVLVKRTALIVTSRPLQSGHLEHLESPWQQWNLLPFDEARIVEFIERWHRYLPDGELSAAERKVDAAALARTFFSDPSLKPLADTPLMLGTLLFVHHRDKKLPSGRVDLYERYIAAMLGLRDSGLGIEARATKLSDKEKRRILSHIALHFHLSGENEASDQAMRTLVKDALEKFKLDENVDRLLAALCERTGLLQGPGAWSFMHKTIGEFLVAELICDGTSHLPNGHRLDRKELWEHRDKDAWTAVLFFWAGKTSPRELEEFIEDLVGDNGLALALALLNDQGDRLSHEIQRGILLHLIKKPWGNQDEDGRYLLHTGTTPTAVHKTFSAKYRDLRGLTRASNVDVLRNMISRGVLNASDMKVVGRDQRDELTIALVLSLHKFGRSLFENLLENAKNISTNELALYCLSLEIEKTTKFEEIWLSELLNVWTGAFPFGREWVPFLLIGMLFESRERKHLISNANKRVLGPLLWAWRGQPVNTVWLQGSIEWSAWPTNKIGDLLSKSRMAIIKDDAATWGVNTQQLDELRNWFDQLLAMRSEL